MCKDSEQFDFSEYTEFHPMYNEMKYYCEKTNLNFDDFKDKNKK